GRAPRASVRAGFAERTAAGGAAQLNLRRARLDVTARAVHFPMDGPLPRAQARVVLRLATTPGRSPLQRRSATSDRQGPVRSASQSKAAEVTVACLGKTRLRSISCASRSGSAQQSPGTKIR